MMAVWRWLALAVMVGLNLVLAAWLLGWSSWLPFPHESPREPQRAEQELRANAVTLLPSPNPPASANTGSNPANPND